MSGRNLALVAVVLLAGQRASILNLSSIAGLRPYANLLYRRDISRRYANLPTCNGRSRSARPSRC